MNIDNKVSEGESLTNWVNEPDLLQIKHDFDASKPAHDSQMARINRWSELLKVSGRSKPKTVKGRSSVQPKLVRRQAEWRYSALTEPFLGSDKLFNVRPSTFEDVKSAKQNGLILNWQFRTKLNKVNFIDDFVRATVDEGTCIVRLGWERETVKKTISVPTFDFIAIADDDEENLIKFGEAIEFKETNPRGFDEQASEELKAAIDYFVESQQPTFATKVSEEEEVIEDVLQNHPTVSVKNPNNIYIDPSCEGDLNNAMFVIESFETSHAELQKKGKRYKNLDKVNWSDNSPMNDPDHVTSTPSDFQFKDSARKRVLAYEYWGFYDIHGDGKLHPIVCTWIGNTMIRMEENPFPDKKLPYVLVPYMPIKRDLYGEPDAELLEDNQKILGAVTRGMIDLLGRSANGQQGFAKGLLDPLNKRRYESGADYEFNPNTPVNQGLIEHKYPDIPQSAVLMLNLQNNEAEALTGVKSFAGGVSGDSYGDVVKGISTALDAASKREMAILRRLAKGMQDIGMKIAAMNSSFLSEEETVRVTNSEFTTIKRDDLEGNFDLIVDISTAEVDNAKANDLAFMLQTIGNNMDINITLMILSEIAELKRMPELAHKLKTFEPQPDPVEQALKELAVQKAQLDNQEIQSEIDLNNAKAEEARAKADQATLDYVEQETGTKHARNIEQNKAQAAGNQELEITKALTKSRKEGEIVGDVEAAIGFNQLTKDQARKDNEPDPVLDTTQNLGEESFGG